jgi:phosphonate transport system substrate-binding protein
VFGARAAWVDRESAAGYLVIRAALRARGLGFERAFKEEKFYGSHDAVVRAVLHGEADVGATYVHVLPDDSIGKAGWGAADVKVLARYGPIPADVIAASSSLPGDQVRAVQAALTNPKERTLLTAAKRLLEADGFVEAESTHLRPLDALLRFLDDSPRRWGSMFPPAK